MTDTASPWIASLDLLLAAGEGEVDVIGRSSDERVLRLGAGQHDARVDGAPSSIAAAS